MQITNITIKNAFEQTKFVDEVLNLGVILDNTLYWEPQVTRVTKVNKSLFGFRFIEPCTTQALRKRLVESLVLLYLGYCGYRLT